MDELSTAGILGWTLLFLCVSSPLVLFSICPPVIVLCGRLVKLHPLTFFRTVKLSNLSNIRVHYQYAAGTVFVWEFIPQVGTSMVAHAMGLDVSLVQRLEKHLGGFSAERFYSLIEDDFVGWVDVWCSHQLSNRNC